MANNILSEEFNDDCGVDSPVKCKSLSRIKAILNFYQIINNENSNNENELQKLLVEYIDTNKYFNLCNDYHHLLLKHLDQENDVDNSTNFERINTSIYRHVKCNIEKCRFYDRNGRDRENNTQKEENKNDEKGLFYMDMLDNIHVLFVHAYDSGFRVKASMYDNKPLKSEEKEEDTEMDYNDTVMTKLESHINVKRQQLINSRGKQRVAQNKFCTNTNLNKESLQNSEEKQPENPVEEKEKVKAEKAEVGEYFFGHRYYYWDWYKNNDDTDALFNPGYKYKDWYIKKKYNDMKEEILNKLSLEQYNIAKNKATELLSLSNTLKELKCRRTGDANSGNAEYDIKQDEPITIAHLMSLIFYCDYSKLSYDFSKTFRKISSSESDTAMKDRNSMFWHWSKTLMESVHLYGNTLNGYDKPHISVLYHGVSYMYFSSFHTRFCAPASMTRQICVATMFADWNGIILEIEGESSESNNSANMRPFYFNCTLLSRFGSEDERLFIGGVGQSGGYYSGDIPDGGLLHFRNIRMMETKQNYFWFVKILTLLNIIVNGKDVANFKQQFKKSENWFLRRTLDLFRNANIKLDLFKEEKNEKSIIFPEYILVCFKKWIKKTSYVRLRAVCFNYNYASFNAIFPCCDQCELRLFLFDKILNVFPSCTEIEVNMGGPMSEAMDMPINGTYINELISILRRISDSKPNNKLEEIRIISIYSFQMTQFDSFLPIFNQQNWKWKIEKQKMAGRNPFENMSCQIKINYISTGKPIIQFCLPCKSMSHFPSPCSTATKWLTKCKSEAETISWILAKTKRCPKCQVNIQKNQRNNHMTCGKHIGGCGYEFCWLCKGDWNKHSICNIYEKRTSKGKLSQQQIAQQNAQIELERYEFYYTRFDSHLKSSKQAIKCKEIQFLVDGADEAIHSWHVLAWTYPIAYYLDDFIFNADLFKQKQGKLETFCDLLQEKINVDVEKLSDNQTRQEIIGYTHTVQKYRQDLVQYIETEIPF